MSLLSIVVPAYNEERNLPLLQQRLNPVLDQLKSLGVDVEILLLDNCSSDRTREIGLEMAKADPRWKYIRYSRNFGYHNSLACGYDLAKGDALIVLASDLQEPPEQIPNMVRMWQEGYDVVYGILQVRNDSTWLKTLGAKIFYNLFSYLSDTDIPRHATDFRIISRRVIDAVKNMRESDRYLRGLVHWAGFKQKSFLYNRDPRKHGESTAGIWVSTKWALNATFCFSNKPLRAIAIFGLFVLLFSILLSLYFLYIYFFPPQFMHIAPTGTTVIVMLLLFGIGLHAVSLGIIGEYVGRIYNQSKLRPLYIIDEAKNVHGYDVQGRPLPDLTSKE